MTISTVKQQLNDDDNKYQHHSQLVVRIIHVFVITNTNIDHVNFFLCHAQMSLLYTKH